MKPTRLYLLAAASLLLAGLIALNGCAGTPSREEAAEHFVSKVKPVLEYYCLECHNSKSAPKFGGLNLETGGSAVTTGLRKPVIRPGKPEESLLFVVLRLGHEEALGMPPAPDKILDEQLAAIRQWIRDGAVWPDGPEGRLRAPQ
jgi:mono/diheme cytochrome c family protein